MLINKIYFRFWNVLLIQAILMQQTHDAYECHAWFWVFKLKQQKVFDPSEFSKIWNSWDVTVDLLGVELAGVAGLDDCGCILKHWRPVEAAPEDLACEGAWGRVVAALPAVDVVDELAAFLGRDAPQRNPVGALTVQVSVVGLSRQVLPPGRWVLGPLVIEVHGND